MTAEGGGAAPRTRDWPRALGLLAVAFGLSIVRPSVLIGVPLIALLLVHPRPKVSAFALGALAAVLAFGAGRGDGLWYAERGWAILLAGWFAAVTLRWPGARLFPRAAASVAGAAAVVAGVLALKPGAWIVLDWLVESRIREGVGAGLEALERVARDQGGLNPALVDAFQRATELQTQLFPAMLGLASLAALGVAWWLHRRLAGATEPALGAVSEFRFNDHLVWVLIAGLVLLIAGWGGAWGRAGSNTVVFMAGLYALRGLGVVLFLTGGLSLLGAAMLFVALLFAPVLLALALVIGLGDTWMNLRERLGKQPA